MAMTSPSSSSASSISPRQVVAGILTRTVEGATEILICQRRADQTFAHQWEFPGGKVEPGEGFPAALVRELDEELGIRAEVGRRVAVVRHTYQSGRAVELHFFHVERYKGDLDNRIFQQVLWQQRTSLTQFDFLEADRGIVQALARGELL
ncbi:MAG TPA: (deoxy)nucleoside triphosphate pyrophosphohydrolase [candidate division Zixibacteria bacterium]|nr:(deoxy)nucleoside triphosphate pyrophosphohydrolase [candidate division Zixibacteria bacterium]